MLIYDLSIDELIGLAAQCADQLDRDKLALGSVVAALAERYGGDLKRAVDDVASVVQTQVARSTVLRYAQIVQAFPEAEALMARHAHIGLGTLDLARRLPPEAREVFIEQVAAHALPLTKQRRLAQTLRGERDYSRENLRAHSEALLSEITLHATVRLQGRAVLLEGALDGALCDWAALDGAQAIVTLRPVRKRHDHDAVSA